MHATFYFIGMKKDLLVVEQNDLQTLLSSIRYNWEEVKVVMLKMGVQLSKQEEEEEQQQNMEKLYKFEDFLSLYSFYFLKRFYPKEEIVKQAAYVAT